MDKYSSKQNLFKENETVEEKTAKIILENNLQVEIISSDSILELKNKNKMELEEFVRNYKLISQEIRQINEQNDHLMDNLRNMNKMALEQVIINEKLTKEIRELNEKTRIMIKNNPMNYRLTDQQKKGI